MTIQHFATGTVTVEFPWMHNPQTRGTGQTAQLRKLCWHAPAKRLVGVFTDKTTDYEIVDFSTNFLHYRLAYIWRDGTKMDAMTVPVVGWGNIFLVTQNNLGETIRTDRGYYIANHVATAELSAVHSGIHFYPISERWAHDILPEPRGAVTLFLVHSEGTYLVGSTTAYAINPQVFQPTFTVQKKPTNSVVFTATGATWRHPRDLIYINGTRTAATFMQDSGGTVKATSPALIRLFATTTDPWTLLWTDTLPATDSVAAYDPEH